MVLGVEEVDDEADPAGGQDEDPRDDFADQGDRLLADVNDGEDGKDQADEVNDSSHSILIFNSFHSEKRPGRANGRR